MSSRIRKAARLRRCADVCGYFNAVGTALLNAAGWLAMVVPYTLGWRTAAVVCGTVWSLMMILGLVSGFKENVAKIAEGMETSPRAVVAAAQ